ncbi:MAG: RDD family protein [Phycisphaerales bacterium]
MRGVLHGWVAWLRWLVPVALLWIAAAAPDGPALVATSSGDHLWWVQREEKAWIVTHGAKGPGGTLVRHAVAKFDEAPAALAAEGDRVWVLFGAKQGRCELVRGTAVVNPASDLWFVRPAGMRLCASLPRERVASVAAIDGELWALCADTPSRALRLIGETWVEVELPSHAPAATRREFVRARGGLWYLVELPDGSTLRWVRESGAWRSVPIALPVWTRTIPGADLLCVQASDGSIGMVEGGRFVARGMTPARGVVLGWGDGIGALEVGADEVTWAPMAAAGGAFEDARIVDQQASTAARWFHLPVLGVLSLGALMLAAILKAARQVRGTAMPGGPPVGMPVGRRIAALAFDAAPVGLAAMMAFDVGPEALFGVPLWVTDLDEARPFIWMTVGTVAFGMLEECAGSRSMGKRIFGGAVRGSDGSDAGWPRHVIRNLLKGLTMLSPVLALPALVSRRGVGVSEVVTDTAVVRA